MTKIAEMKDFFNSVANEYEAHMFEFVQGAKEYYLKTAEFIAQRHPQNLLDLGCGTGLQLDEIFKFLPNVQVVGIDLADKLLDKLRQKHSNKDITLINVSYLDWDYPINHFDCALAVMTLHHFDYDTKVSLYKKIYQSLINGGFFIETDYIITDEKEEAFYIAERKRLRAENNIVGLDMYDTPLTLEHEISALKEAGFSQVEQVWAYKDTRIVIAQK